MNFNKEERHKNEEELIDVILRDVLDELEKEFVGVVELSNLSFFLQDLKSDNIEYWISRADNRKAAHYWIYTTYNRIITYLAIVRNILKENKSLLTKNENKEHYSNSIKILYKQYVYYSKLLAIESKKTEEEFNTFLIVDIETTGLGDAAQIIKLILVNPKGEKVFESLFNPSIDITKKAEEIHGISKERLINEPKWSDKWTTIKDMLKDKVLVINNTEYGLRCIQSTCKAFNLDIDDVYHSVCLMREYTLRYKRVDNLKDTYKCIFNKEPDITKTEMIYKIFIYFTSKQYAYFYRTDFSYHYHLNNNGISRKKE